ncbi:uncharacterized protein KNAG_0F01560 [Huiozyma naganishii CBS 8797]|uniref:Uncharacterized protein n=1 Tax=Huiozyma naganishii (strain ATCC MYA-139 / BCRC 22969 / CBS 8797 / KCTC 17520 / NBRC 10181 / NCYC 3082 / Yp74L-3) TaxID=1071383 RepID=J7S780_HUIN7|nr:hypothetical protein KNAG_0F01560 [Kazachstania naganishii CBS 8797]CCK70824.1 hypothetical protein KNAG_0F01560 [Kazachstania naganishii CBS 8797]
MADKVVATPNEDNRVLLKRLIRYALFFALVAVLWRNMLSVPPSGSGFVSRLWHTVSSPFGNTHATMTHGQNRPAIGVPESDTLDANPVDVTRLVSFVVLCVLITIPFFL